MPRTAPLADLLRPTKLEDIAGIEPHLSQIQKLSSFIFWGPPGCGKTSCSRIVARNSQLQVFSISAVAGSSQQFKDVFSMAEKCGPIVLLVDEIHHLNRSQQDLFLPHLESGNIILIGTTTENPSFSLRSALLSRCKVIVFSALSQDSLEALLQKAEHHFQKPLPLTLEARTNLKQVADGDGRSLLNMVEDIVYFHEHRSKSFPDNDSHLLDASELTQIISRRFQNYDKSSDGHYNLISALHKSMRGSDVDAALYWMSRMLEGGEDPLYIARRVIRFASEDIGMADPQALVIALHAQQAYMALGSPEGELALAHAVVYMSTAPKSNAVYKGFNQARAAAQKGSFPPPRHILNAPTTFMKNLGYGEGYLYDHDQPHSFSGQNYFPENMPRQKFYFPIECGFEREIKKRLDWWAQLRLNKNQ